MTIQWPEDTQSDEKRARNGIPSTTREFDAHLAALRPLAVEEIAQIGIQRTSRGRDALAVLAFIVILLALGAALWFFGPLPRIFPATPGDWFPVHL